MQLNAVFPDSLYCPPELLKNRESNRRRGMDQNWLKQSTNRRQAGDIYAFGMVMYENLFAELTDMIKDGTKIIKPAVQDRNSIHPDLVALLQDCWHETPEVRPSI